MLEHSPPLPLVIDHADKNRSPTLENEEGIKLALRHHNRICRIRLAMITPCPSKLINGIDKEFPILEHLYIDPVLYSGDGFVLPETFRAPNLRHLILLNCALPAGSTFNHHGPHHIIAQLYLSIRLMAPDRSSPSGFININAPAADTWDLVFLCYPQS